MHAHGAALVAPHPEGRLAVLHVRRQPVLLESPRDLVNQVAVTEQAACERPVGDLVLPQRQERRRLHPFREASKLDDVLFDGRMLGDALQGLEHVRPARNQEHTRADSRPDRFVRRRFVLDFDLQIARAPLAQDIPQGLNPLSRCDVHEARRQVAGKLAEILNGLRRGHALPERSLQEHARFPRCVVDRHVRPAVVLLVGVAGDAIRLEIEGARLPDEIDERRRHARRCIKVENVSERDCRRALRLPPGHEMSQQTQ